MTNDLVDIVLSSSGQMLDEQLVDNAVAQIRNQAGWHIAPVRTETVAVGHFGGSPFLVLPTRRAVSVSAIRRNGVTVAAGGYMLLPSGLLHMASRRGWEFGTYEIDLTHGYATCPPELVGLIAKMAQGEAQADPTVARVSVGAVAYDYRDASAGGWLDNPILSRYTLPGAVA